MRCPTCGRESASEYELADRAPPLDLVRPADRALLRAEVVGAIAAFLEEGVDEGVSWFFAMPPSVRADTWLEMYDSQYNDEHHGEERPFPPWSQYA